MKKLKTFFKLLNRGIKNHYEKYDIVTRYPSHVGANAFATVITKKGNIDKILDIFLSDLTIVGINTRYCILQICTPTGSILMQFMYVFNNEEIIFEFATDDLYSSIGWSAVSEADFFNNIGYYEYDSNDL